MKKNIEHKHSFSLKNTFSSINIQILFLIIISFWFFLIIKSYIKHTSFNPFNLNIIRWILFTGHFPQGSGPGFLKAFTGHIYGILLLFSVVVSSWWIGRKIWEIIKFEDLDCGSEEKTIYYIATGIWFIIMFILFAGFIGALYSWLMRVLIIVTSFAGFYEIFRINFSENKDAVSQKDKGKFFFPFLPLVVFLAAFAVNIIGALTPETFYDSLVYNIGLSQNWINNNKIFSTRYMVTSFFPLNITVFYTLGILLKDEILAKLFAFSFNIGTAISIYIFTKKYFSEKAGYFALLLFYTTPIVMLVSWKTAIEPGLAFFEFLSLFSFINFIEKENKKFLYLSAFFTGVSMGGKYIAFFTTVTIILIILIEFIINKKRFKEGIRISIIYSIIVFAVAMVWYIKNFIITGDPFYPILWEFNNHITSSDPAPIKLTFSNIIFFPWKYCMGMLQQESYLGPMILFTLPLLFVKKYRKYEKLLLEYFIIYFLIWVTVGKGYSRFFIPAVASFSILIGICLEEIKFKYIIKNSIILMIIFISLFNVYYTAMISRATMDPLGYFLGMQSKKKYLSIQRNTYPNPYYDAADWINKNTSEDSVILLAGECRGFYIKRRFITHMVSDKNPLVEFCKNVKDEDELYRNLKKKNINYLLLNLPEAHRLRGYNLFYFTPSKLEMFSRFWDKYVVEVYRTCSDITLNNWRFASTFPEFWNKYLSDDKNYIYIYRILNESEKSLPHIIPKNYFLEPILYTSKRYNTLGMVIEKIKKNR